MKVQGNKLETIYWKDDYKIKLKDMIKKEGKVIEYLENIIDYFETNNIEKYKKFDKRDLDKIKKYLEEKGMLHYKDCGDNFSIHAKEEIRSKVLYIYVDNEEQYNCDIEIFTRDYEGNVEFHNVIEQAKSRLEYVKAIYEQNNELLDNFDNCIKGFNNRVREFKSFIDNTHLNNIVDIYIYAGKECD